MTDQEILALEERFPTMSPAKQRALIAAGVPMVRYLQRVARLMATPEVEEGHPQLVRRWHRIRAQRWNGSTRARATIPEMAD